MEKRVLRYIRDKDLAEEGSRIGIALSGGPDSMALLYCLNNLRSEQHFDICALHMEHGIRGAKSVSDAEFAANQCAKLGIELYIERRSIPELAKRGKLSVETAGRIARLDFFKRIIEEKKADCIATAHHADDNAESVLMHILRGSGLNGIVGIARKNDFIIRPFLNFTKAEILGYINKNNIPYRTDETNGDNAYARNFVRNVLLKYAERAYPNAIGALNRLSEQARRDNDYIESEAKKLSQNIVIIKDGKAEIDIKKLLDCHISLSTRIIISALKQLGFKSDIEEKHINALYQIAETYETGKRADIINGFSGFVRYGKLVIEKRTDAAACAVSDITDRFKINANFPGVTLLPNGDIIEAEIICGYNQKNSDKFRECFDFDKLPKNCIIRQINNEDTSKDAEPDVIYPLGAPGRKKLKRYFSDKKVPKNLRNTIPVIAVGNNIVWAIGYTVSDKYKIDENTKNIIEIKYLIKEK